MTTFDVYSSRKRLANEPERIEVVKDGFSWPAFILGVPWMLFKRMWTTAALFLLVGLLLFELQVRLGVPADEFSLFDVVGVAIQLLIGMNGNQWVRATLERTGLERVGRVEAANPAAALEAHHDENRLWPPAR